MSRVWNSGLFNCGHDLANCCCGYFCGCCLMWQNANHLDESGALCFLLGLVSPCIPTFLIRSKARERFNIEGSSCADAAIAVFCSCCSNIQVANELNNQEK
eukprot:TRINITY_DN51382_c0_g1_i1.p1 TRINITY_DN51382_c0_g1~~TRINITY_DN51382_c0_g1_i1.p1  ORF type:complete len:111 (-),score=20.61 TRINITY_DN51382_c0_g1_i1:38-340(-)